MQLVEVEILTQAITAQYGTLSAGDILRTTPEFARHLVDDAQAARYTTPPAPPSTTRAARTPSNKKAPEPDNKSAPPPEADTTATTGTDPDGQNPAADV